MRHGWTEPQVAALIRWPNIGAGAVKPLLDSLGPERSIEAIKSKRSQMAWRLRNPQQAGDRNRTADLLRGWPSTSSCPIQQDRNYLKALLSDQADWPGDTASKAATARRIILALSETAWRVGEVMAA